MIYLVGLGDGDGRHMSIGGAEALLSARCVVLRTARCGAVERLDAMGVAYEHCDDLYAQAEDFTALGKAVAERVLVHARKGGDVAFASPGSGGIGDALMAAVSRAAREENLETTCFPAGSRADALAMASGAAEAASIVFAVDAPMWRVEPRRAFFVMELDKRLLASEAKLRLLDVYPDEHSVCFHEHGGADVWMPLHELDRQRDSAYGHEAALLIPPAGLMQLERFDVRHLEEIMAILRGRREHACEGITSLEGCPWDKEQTHESLKQYLVEEAWETLAAIDDGDTERFYDELGDVLLQVAFHAQIAREHGEFTMDDVSTAVCRKMISRHPHIFGTVEAKDSEAVLANWEAIKKAEKGLSSKAQVMADVPQGFPGLMRAQKVQGKAEPKEQASGEASARLISALGDMLFAAARVARLSGINAEMALHDAVENYIEQHRRQEDLP